MVKICPVSNRLVDEKLCRFNAFYTFSFVCGFLVTGSFWFLLIMAVDFALRLYNKGMYNPILRLNKFFLELFHVSRSLINAGPKIFAARAGLLLSVLSIVGFLVSAPVFSAVFAGILGFFSLLELTAGFCVACRLYPYALLINDNKLFR